MFDAFVRVSIHPYFTFPTNFTSPTVSIPSTYIFRIGTLSMNGLLKSILLQATLFRTKREQGK